MRARRLFWRVFPSYVLITVAVLLLVSFYGREAVDQLHARQTRAALESGARIFAELVTDDRLQDNREELDRLAKQLGPSTGLRITVIGPSGKVIADAHEDPALMDNHAGRPEVAAAIENQTVGYSVRYSDTIKAELAYVAVPVLREGRTVAVVRAARETSEIQAVAAALERRVFAVALSAVVVITVLSWWIARRISRPLERMSDGAARFAQGDLEHRLRIEGSREVAALAEAMNEMASQLDERIATIIRQRDEQDAILDSMAEGVLALDSDGRILGLNPACSRMFHLDPAVARGRPIHEVLRKADVLAFVEEALASPLPAKRDLAVRDDPPRWFTASSTALYDRRKQRIGVLVVLNDVTRLRQLENVRREFVANASHELRTPVTSIKGFVETLLDGGLDDRQNAERFLTIVLNQANRLESLFNDILSLARIEKESEEQAVELRPGHVDEVLESVVQSYRPRADRKRINLVCESSPGLEARINPRLLEQAVANLVDNAVKYGTEGSTVRILARRDHAGLVIEVTDEGPGIDPKHFPRLFERFYRVDKARSDKLGGTGLGLAIVKHIAAAHGGSVSVDSRIGRGSTFRIHLP
ncbi:MAG: HAMP domain-containing protein [Pirellulales bacterium]|nr:HAMP domain-containing protein [Pirellulales bacterium]